MRERLVELITHRLRTRFWLSLLLGLAADVIVLVPLATLGATQHPESAGALIAVVSGAVAGPLAGFTIATGASRASTSFLASAASSSPPCAPTRCSAATPT